MADRARGLVALGDSITNGEGAPMLGVRAWSWAQWLATALEAPYLGLARNAARAADVAGEQVPRLRAASPTAPLPAFAVGCLYAGVNDVRGLDWDAAAYATALGDAARAAAAACERVVMPTMPLDLGRPRAGAAKVREANAIVLDTAAAVDAVPVRLDDLRGWRLVLPDAVHLTALGQLEVAARAAAALGAPSPYALADVDRTPRGAARYALTGHATALARDLRRRALERRALRRR